MANSRVTSPAGRNAVKNKKLKCAVFGAGYWAGFQIPCWNELGGVEIVAIQNRTFSKAQRLAERFGIPKVYENAIDLMKNEDFDFADIITETPAHEGLTLAALELGIPVICQKPMSDTMASCGLMISAAEKAKAPFFIHDNFRWQTPMREVKKALDANAIGAPVRAHMQFGTGGEKSYIKQPYLAQIDHTVLRDMGPHVFDVCRYLFGEIDSVYAKTVKTIQPIAGDDTAVILAVTDQIPVVCEVVLNCVYRIFVEGMDGILRLDNDNRLWIQKNACAPQMIDTNMWPRYPFVSDDDWEHLGGDCIDSIVACNRSFLEAFRSGGLPETSYHDYFKTTRAVFAAIRSVEENRSISMREMD